MQIAHNKNKERILIRDASNSEQYYCPICNEELIVKGGLIKRRHFAHKPNRMCSEYRYADMCEWHINWQNRFPEDNIEVIKTDENGKKHIADALINNIELEFQHSHMPYEEFNDRNEFYNKLNYHVIWVFDGNDIFKKGYNYGPFPFSKKFECFKKIDVIPSNVDIFIEGETQINLFSESGLFLHHVNKIDEKEGIIFDGKCTIEEFLMNVNNSKPFVFAEEKKVEQNEMNSEIVSFKFRGRKLIDIVNQFPNVDNLIVENTMTNYEVLIDKYNINRMKQGKKVYGRIKSKSTYGKFMGNEVEIFYINNEVWKFKKYY